MKPKLFDLHCDTLYEILRQNKRLSTNDLHISLERLSEYERHTQVFAMWSDPRNDEDTSFRRFEEAAALLKNELSKSPDTVFCRSGKDLANAESLCKNSAFLAVEGGRLLSDKLERLNVLYDEGVRFLTLVWDGNCKIGGAFDTSGGLTDFGRKTVEKCFELGIVPDISHASDKMISEVIEMAEKAGKKCIATHSNSRFVCNHPRNLTDENFKRISNLGGIVGISLAPMHICENYRDKCDIDDVVRHIEHYISIGGENTVALGCDFDGVSYLPNGISNVSDVCKIADKLKNAGFSDTLINKIFYENAREFIFRNLL